MMPVRNHMQFLEELLYLCDLSYQMYDWNHHVYMSRTNRPLEFQCLASISDSSYPKQNLFSPKVKSLSRVQLFVTHGL